MPADGILTMTGTGKAGTAFLGHGMGKMDGPATVKLRVRSASGGAGQIDCYPNGLGDESGRNSTFFNVKEGDWHELTVDISARGPLGTMRLFLPATSDKPVEIDSIEVTPANRSAQRWDF